MTFTGVELIYPPPKGEISVNGLIKRPIPNRYSQLTYVIHPSTVEGDNSKIAQKPIQKLVDSQQKDSRVILIAPPQECVYLRPGSVITDVRSDQSYINWASQQDYPDDVENITLVGGNLERCLGAVCEDVKGGISLLVERGILKRENITLTLPLDAIYTVSGVPADAVLNRLMKEANPLEAILGLLTTAEPYNGNYGEFEIISSFGGDRYEIGLDGKAIGILSPKKEEISDVKFKAEPESSKISWTPIIIPQRPIITYKLNLTTGNQQTSYADTQIGNITGRLKHAREIVIPKYLVEATK